MVSVRLFNRIRKSFFIRSTNLTMSFFISSIVLIVFIFRTISFLIVNSLPMYKLYTSSSLSRSSSENLNCGCTSRQSESCKDDRYPALCYLRRFNKLSLVIHMFFHLCRINLVISSSLKLNSLWRLRDTFLWLDT